MSKGTLTAAQAERSDHHTMRNKLNIRSVQLIFSVIMLLTFAGLTGCQDKESEFLEKELEQEESGETAAVDSEQEELKDKENEKSLSDGADQASKSRQDSSEQESRQLSKDDSKKNFSIQSESGDSQSSKNPGDSTDNATDSDNAQSGNTEITEADQSSVMKQPVPQTIYVDICGAVANPGVYELSSDSRVFQAIEKAGGYLPEAAASYLNRARSLSDGQQIYVPTQEEVDSQTIPPTQDGAVQDGVAQGTTQTGDDTGNTASGVGNTDGTGTNSQPASGSQGGTAAATSSDSRINLNTADVSQLTTLTGVGESKALAIIAYREENGPFTSIEDIMNVPGIKEGTYEKIKDKIAIE